MSRWSFTLPIDLRSKNRVANARDHRLSGAIKKRLRDKWTTWARLVALSTGVPLFGDGKYAPAITHVKRRVTLVRLLGKGQRAFDRNDGMEGGDAATLRDALQMSGWRGGTQVHGAGVVVADDERWSEWRYAQERSADGKPGVRIEVEDIEPAAPARSTT